jgi:3-isopropylmalate/(R)-2-methylmalate dehydratase small subunit
MEKFVQLKGIAAPLLVPNVDTDAIIPSIWVLDPATNLGDKLFANWRYDTTGNEEPGFVLNQPRYKNAQILIAGPNFGCGSSREAAVWALKRFGIRCIIAPSYGDIFYENCLQNGLLPIHLAPVIIDNLVRTLGEAPESFLEIDLKSSTIQAVGHEPYYFSVPAERREALLLGLDTNTLMLSWVDDVRAFEERDSIERPWIYPNCAAPCDQAGGTIGGLE